MADFSASNTARYTGTYLFPKQEIEQLILALFDEVPTGRVLIVEDWPVARQFKMLADCELVVFETSGDISQKIEQMTASGPYDAAIVLPTFGAVDTDIPPPSGWELNNAPSEDLWVAHALEELKPGAPLVALVPHGLLSNTRRLAMRRALIEKGLSVVISLPSAAQPGTFSLLLSMIKVRAGEKPQSLLMLNLMDLERWPTTDEVQHFLSDTAVDGLYAGVRTEVSKADLDEDYRLDPAYYDPKFLQIKAPEGYREVSLEDVAEIRGGLAWDKARKRFDSNPGNGTPYVQVRHILEDGTIDDNLQWLKLRSRSEDETGWAKPGDILVTVAGTIGKVAIVPESFVDGVYHDTSLRRVRVDPEQAPVRDVYESLRSELVQLQLRRKTSGSVIPQLTSGALASTRIFLPTPQATLPADSNRSAAAITALQSSLIDFLQKVQTDNKDWTIVVSEKLRNLADSLQPTPLEHLILNKYPTPIAIPFRRFQVARFNNYERIDRLVNLVESCVYFVFHVLMADYCRNSQQNPDRLGRGAREARKGSDSIGYKLQFIEEVLAAAASKEFSLYMPDLANSCVVEVGNKIRQDVRNPMAHTGPSSEAHIEALVERYWPTALKLLDSLRFLQNYTLCQIRSHTFYDERWHYQADVFRGAEYDINTIEQTLDLEDGELPRIEAERKHLVIVNASYDILDLFPFYQVHYGQETGYEPHLCFYKGVSNMQLRGESIRSSVEVVLPGYDGFRRLIGEAANPAMAQD